MSDQCKHCIMRGNVKLCEETPCFHRESWYVQELLTRHNALVEAVARLQKLDRGRALHPVTDGLLIDARAEVDRLIENESPADCKGEG